MTKTATINMRIEPTVKAQAEDVFSSFGISAPKSSAASARSAPSNFVMGNSMNRSFFARDPSLVQQWRAFGDLTAPPQS